MEASTTPYATRARPPNHEAGEDHVPALDIFWLRFRDPAVERRYLEEQFRRSLPFIRLSLLSAAVLYALFGVLDYLVVDPRHLQAVWMLRYGVGVGTLGVVVLFTYSRHFLDHAQLALSVATLNTGLCIIAMTAVTDEPANYLYYAGLIAVVFYACTMIRLHTHYSILISVFLVALYLGVAAWVNPIPEWALISNSFFLVMAVGVGVLSCYAMEVHLRQKFARNIALEEVRQIESELKDQAISANKAKTEFLATMSHELRTPLNAIIGFAEMMEAQMLGPLGASKYVDYATDICGSAKHLLAIISDILDITKADSGKMELNEQDVDASDVLRNVYRMCSNAAAGKGVRLGIDFPEWSPIVRVDERLVQQAIQNLVTNAIKFTPSAGAVRMELATTRGGGCRIRVVDSGVGIAPEDQRRIFEPFTQLQSAFARDHGGTGLGLPLVGRIVELHGGRLHLESELGAGTQVSIELPRERVVGYAELESVPLTQIGSA